MKPLAKLAGPGVWRAAVLMGTAVLATSGLYLLALRIIDLSSGTTFTNEFSLWLFAAHWLTGLAILVPFIPFGLQVLWSGRESASARSTILLAVSSSVVIVSGLALCQFSGLPRLLSGTVERNCIYAVHLAAPLVAAAAYLSWWSRRQRIVWRWGLAWASATSVLLAATLAWHCQQPQQWFIAGTENASEFFEPSKTRTVDGQRIAAHALMSDEYCRRCHEDAYQDWFHSVHHFSSFNNPVYRFSIRETREVGLARDGDVRASRWCAGCHDPVPLLSGQFDNPDYDDVNNPTAHAGITCLSCHAVTHVNSTVGNGAYTIESPQHYPGALSNNSVARWVSDQLLKARPDFHKKSMLKPFHRSSEFCSTCHKVSLPMALNHYKEFLRGQDHYDSFLLSGVSGHGARGFYYPPVAQAKCHDCHMPLRPSSDFGSRPFDGSGLNKIHSHFAPGANTGVLWLASRSCKDPQEAERLRAAARSHADFLRGAGEWPAKPALRIDIFGLKPGGTIDGPLMAPLRPALPALVPGHRYLVEVVIRTLNVGHVFTDGTADSNEVWVEFVARAGGRVIGESGGLEGPADSGEVDRGAHFVKALVLDRHGHKINRHNPQDIFVAVYDHQIPPGAAQVVHYALDVPSDVSDPVELSVRLRYRKFDYEYSNYVALQNDSEFWSSLRSAASIPDLLNRPPAAVARMLEAQLDRAETLPIIDLCEDHVVLPLSGATAGAIAGDATVSSQFSRIDPAWQRWNDYGIGCYLEGGAGMKRGELRQAERAFRQLLALPDTAAHSHGLINLARVYLDEGRLEDAASVLNQARTAVPPAPWWTLAWLTGMVNVQTGHLDDAITNFQLILNPANQPRDRHFDFTKDYVVINELANTLFKRAQQEAGQASRAAFLDRAVHWYWETLRLDSEDLLAHYGLSQCFSRLGGVEHLPVPVATKEVVTAAMLKSLAANFADTVRPPKARLQSAADLLDAMERFHARPAQPLEPKLTVWQELTATCRTVYEQLPVTPGRTRTADDGIRSVSAALLGRLYRRTHELLKPDEVARARSVRLYRQQHPDADHAAEAIVIYPLRRGEPMKLDATAKGSSAVGVAP